MFSKLIALYLICSLITIYIYSLKYTYPFYTFSFKVIIICLFDWKHWTVPSPINRETHKTKMQLGIWRRHALLLEDFHLIKQKTFLINCLFVRSLVYSFVYFLIPSIISLFFFLFALFIFFLSFFCFCFLLLFFHYWKSKMFSANPSLFHRRVFPSK